MTPGVRHTARGIILRHDSILLMERWRGGDHYFSIPGGLIEPNEAPQQTVIREVREETTVEIVLERQVIEMRDGLSRHYIFTCTYISGEPVLPREAEEANTQLADNYFKPQWIQINTLPDLPFGYWQPLKELLMRGIQQGFNTSVEVVMASKAR